MATISGVVLTLTKSGSNVNAHVAYTLTPSSLDKLAGAVFSDKIELWGEDGIFDQLRRTMASDAYAVNSATTTVSKTRDLLVTKNDLNEDSDTDAKGAEMPDQIYAKVTVTYVANKPIGASDPSTANSLIITGVWK